MSKRINHHKFISEFEYKGKDWLIEGWKGNYNNLGVGAEIGVYYKSPKQPIKHYWAVSDANRLNMFFRLNKKPTQKLFTRGAGRFWWITGFKPGIGVIDKDNLYMYSTIQLKSANMAIEFKKSLNKNRYENNKVAESPRSGSYVRMKWDIK